MLQNTSNYQSYLFLFLWIAPAISVILALYFNIDLVLIAVLVVFVDILIQIVKKRVKFDAFFYRILCIVLIFYGWVIVSNTYSPSPAYKYVKTINFMVNIMFFIYPIFITKINFKIITNLYCIILIPLSIYFIYMKSILWSVTNSSTELFMSVRGAYLILGTHIGILFLILVYFKRKIYLQILAFLLLLGIGARGPLIFAILIFIFLYITNNKITFLHPKYIFKFVIGIITVGTIYIVSNSYIDSLLKNSFTRFESLFGGEDGSALERVNRISFAINQPFDSLEHFVLGNGFGSFGILYDKIDIRSYPHNIFLEAFFELGLIGVSIFLILFISIFRKISFKKNVFHVLFIFLFLNAMKSSGITDLWILFSCMGAIAISERFITEKN